MSTQLLNEPATAEYLGVSRSFLRQARVTGRGPAFVRMGRAIRYRVLDLNTYIEKNVRHNTIRINSGDKSCVKGANR